MKNFSELLDTELYLEVQCNGQIEFVPLLSPLQFLANATVVIDGIEVLPKFWHLTDQGMLTIDQPFYQWYHHASKQGWLLTPC
jgi:hypothetical protein